MAKIITTTQAQKDMCKIANTIDIDSYIVTNKGEGKVVMLPYFDGCGDFIEDYLENLDFIRNKEKLDAELAASIESGESDLVI